MRARTALINTAQGLTKSYGEQLRGCSSRNMNPQKAQGLSPELQAALEPLLGGIESLSQRIREYQRADRVPGSGKLSAGGVAEASEGSEHADRPGLSVAAED